MVSIAGSKGMSMATEYKQPNLKGLGDHITLKFAGAEAHISGFKIAAFTVISLCGLCWLLL